MLDKIYYFSPPTVARMLVRLTDTQASYFNSRIILTVFGMREQSLDLSPKTFWQLQSRHLVIRQCEVKHRVFTIFKKICYSQQFFLILNSLRDEEIIDVLVTTIKRQKRATVRQSFEWQWTIHKLLSSFLRSTLKKETAVRSPQCGHALSSFPLPMAGRWFREETCPHLHLSIWEYF